MANGAFLGGFAEGAEASAKLGLKRDELAQDTALRSRGLDLQSRGLDIQERGQMLANARAAVAQIDKQIAETLGIVSETIKNARAVGRPDQAIVSAVAPLVGSAKSLAAKAGRDPTSIDAMIKAQLLSPTGTETAAATGTAKAVAAVAEERALEAAGVEGLGGFKDKNQKITAENALRDDFLKQSGDFQTIVNFKQRIDVAEKTGAGDLTLVFSFMKMLDPQSVVREGEQASAANAAGVPSAIQGLYNQLIGGGKLSAEARKQIISQSARLFEQTSRNHDKLQNEFANIAKRQKLNVDNVIVDIRPAPVPAAKPAQVEGVTPFGTRFRLVQ